MKLEVRLYAGLKCHNRELPCSGRDEFALDVPDGTTVGQLHEIMQLKSKYPLVNMINGLAKKESWELSDGDRVGIFPPVGGG